MPKSASLRTNITPARRRAIAAEQGIHEQYLYQCLTGFRDMDPVRAVELEGRTHGEITRFMVVTKRGAQIWPELAKEAASGPQRDPSLSLKFLPLGREPQ